jgi:hypothetical protein
MKSRRNEKKPERSEWNGAVKANRIINDTSVSFIGSMKSRRNEEKPERSEWNGAVKANRIIKEKVR